MAQNRINTGITEGVIWKQLLSFFFPILLGTFFQQLYNTVDTIVVGRFVNTQALASMGATAALISLINGFFIGLSTGATVLLSQYFGARDKQGVKTALHTGMGLSLVLGIFIMAVGIFLGPTILDWMGTPAGCREGAMLYVQIYFTGSIASMVYNMGAGILRAMGDSRRPTVFLIIACLVNIAADLLFVIVLDMKIAGVAVATVLSQVISAVLVVITLYRLPEDTALRAKQLRLDKALLKRILMVGIPAGLQMVTFDLANLLIQSGVNSFGDLTVAAWTAYVKTDALIWMISGAFGVSITTFVGQNFGAQRYDRIRKGVWVCMGMSVVLIGIISTTVVLLRRNILGIYTPDKDVVELAAFVMTCTMPFTVLFMPVEVFAGTMRGTGYSVMPTVITCLSVCLFRVIWIFTAVRQIHEVYMLAICYPISWALAAVVFYIVYLQGNWLKKRIEACGMPPEMKLPRRKHHGQVL